MSLLPGPLAASAMGPYLAASSLAFPTRRYEPRRMPKVHMNYGGWLTLPTGVRRKLGLSTGAQLELELVGGSVVLTPTDQVALAARPAAEPVITAPSGVQPTAPEPAAVAAPAPVAKRGPGRPRKAAAAPAVLPPSLKARGRRMAASDVRPAAPQSALNVVSSPAAKRSPGRPRKTPTPPAAE
jgi:bifunctional DNA-binding transcriptional regulator/antitoxin component of YhaV-PrlF toxin-antitoxin module